MKNIELDAIWLEGVTKADLPEVFEKTTRVSKHMGWWCALCGKKRPVRLSGFTEEPKDHTAGKPLRFCMYGVCENCRKRKGDKKAVVQAAEKLRRRLRFSHPERDSKYGWVYHIREN